jgi:hypothetical protein
MAAVYACALAVLSEERIFVFSDWELIVGSFRLLTCGCSVSQNSEFLRVESCSLTISSFPTDVEVCLGPAPKNARAWERPSYAMLVGGFSYKMAPLSKD